MPPKAAANVDALDGASAKFLLSALKSCSEFAPDWDQVAKEHDIKYARNAYVLVALPPPNHQADHVTDVLDSIP
jgi:hypothetical protein